MISTPITRPRAPDLLILLETFPHFAEELKEEYFCMKKYNAYFKEIVVG